MDLKRAKSLVINPGSTSTKIAVYHDDTPVWEGTVRHPAAELKKFVKLWDQYNFRKKEIENSLKQEGISFKDIDIIVCRGGAFQPIPSGTYIITESMLADARSGLYGEHASSIGCQIGYDWGKKFHIPVITVDPPCSDEFHNLARYSGIPEIQRKSKLHILNQKATARKIAASIGREYEDLNLIIAHLGGGISVGVHARGKVIDANNTLDGDGPFSPERSGSLPVADLVKLCHRDQDTDKTLKRLTGMGGLVAYLGTNDVIEIENRIEQGDQAAREVLEAMCYQIAKEIGAAAAVPSGKIDMIGLTGGLANSQFIVNQLKMRIGFLAQIFVYPGENEMEALALGAIRFMNGIDSSLNYD